MLVSNDSQPFKDLAGLKKFAEESPGALNYAHLGTGSPTRLLAERAARAMKIELTPVAYPGIAPAQPDFYANRTQLQMVAVSKQFINGPSTRFVAVCADERSPMLPDVPTFKELGYPNIVGGTWFGLFVPAGVPDEIKDKLRTAASDAKLVVKTELEKSGHFLIDAKTPQQFRAYIDQDLARSRADLQAMGEKTY